MKKIIALLLCPSLSFGSCFGTILGFSQDQSGNAIVSFQITNGAQVFFVDDHVPFGANSTQLGEFVASQCNGLQAQSVGFSSATAIGQVIPPFTVGGSVNLFAVSEASWTATLTQYKQYLWAQQHGLIPITDGGLTASSTTLKNLFTTNESTFVAAGIVPNAP